MQEKQERICNHCGRKIKGNFATLIVGGTERSESYCIGCAMDIQAISHGINHGPVIPAIGNQNGKM